MIIDTTGKTFISADDATLNSVNGTVGTEEEPLKLDVNTLTAQGSEVAVNNDKDLEVISVIGKKDPTDSESGNVTIKAEGDITAGNNNGNVNITGNNVDVTASEFYNCHVNLTRLDPENDHYGGAIYIIGNNTDVVDCIFDDCYSILGGTMYIVGHNTTVEGSLMNNSYSTATRAMKTET